MTIQISLADQPQLDTDSLVLRRPNENDIGAIISGVGNWEVACCLARVPHPYGEEDARFFLEHVVPKEWTWAITLKGSDKLIGAVGLAPEDSGNTAELGYWLAQSYWGRGIATAAASAVVSFGLDQLRLPFIKSGYFVENPTSGRVLQKLGFVETARATRVCLAMDREDVPSVEMRLEPSKQS
jgi:RimJ/RimL family protein N-acetyltransferase